ncbi:hypothetical protein BKA62DRAFT_686272 [Auriculariales sp. MPI-PUGE-AT-0066]|nr:hypothetical protein BKA62DRAFT_686272 [Auriculariales sp. MPI-PUGE-AT-0066]
MLVLPVFVLLGTLAVVGARPQPAESKFQRLVVFGDSFSDNGNGTYKLTNETWPADHAYYDGRFSSGPVWPEYLATDFLRVPLLDYAHGGATIDNKIVPGYTGANSDILVPSVADQVDRYLANGIMGMNKKSRGKTVVALVAGINDAFFAGDVDVRKLTDSLVASIEKLVDHDFKTFVVPTTQAGAWLPYYRFFTSAEKIKAQETFSAQFHSNLAKSLRAANLPRAVKVKQWDEENAVKLIIQRARQRGDDPDTACLKGAYGEAQRDLCNDPKHHVFFDIFHPSTETHMKIAMSVMKALLAH